MGEVREHPPSQGKIVSGFLVWLNKGDCRFDITSVPDDTEHTYKACDYICTDGITATQMAVEITTLWRNEGAGREDNLWLRFIGSVEDALAGRVSGTYHIYSPMDDFESADVQAFWNGLFEFLEGANLREDDNTVFEFEGHEFRINKFWNHGSTVEFARYFSDHGEEPSDQSISEFLHRNLKDIPGKFAEPRTKGLETHLVCYNTFHTIIGHDRLLRLLRNEIESLHRVHGETIDFAHVMAGRPPRLDDIYVWTLDLRRSHNT